MPDNQIEITVKMQDSVEKGKYIRGNEFLRVRKDPLRTLDFAGVNNEIDGTSYHFSEDLEAQIVNIVKFHGALKIEEMQMTIADFRFMCELNREGKMFN